MCLAVLIRNFSLLDIILARTGPSSVETWLSRLDIWMYLRLRCKILDPSPPVQR